MAIGLNNSGTGKITLKAPDNCQFTLVLPNRPGNEGEVLTNDGQGNLVWTQGTFPVVSDDAVLYQQASAVVWKWKIANADSAFTITEEEATFRQDQDQTLVHISTLPGSTIDPFKVSIRGQESFKLNADGSAELRLNSPFYVGAFTDSDLSNKQDALQVFGNGSFYGSGALKLPSGTIQQRSSATDGHVRYNTDTQQFEGFKKGAWHNFLQDEPKAEEPIVELVGVEEVVVTFNVEHSDLFEWDLTVGSTILDFAPLRHHQKKRISIKLTHNRDNAIALSWRPNIKWHDRKVPSIQKLPSVTIVSLVTYDFGNTWFGSYTRH